MSQAALIDYRADLDAIANQMIEGEVCRFDPPPMLHRRSIRSVKKEPRSPAQILEKIRARVAEEVMGPVLSASSRENYFKLLQNHLVVYLDSLRATRVMLDTFGASLSVEVTNVESFSSDLQKLVIPLAGEIAAKEISFDIATYARAQRVARQIKDLDANPSDPKHDRELARQFYMQSALHSFGINAIMIAAQQSFGASQSGIECSFELARGGAIRAYAAAREAFSLRIQHMIYEGDGSPAEVDSSYMALAAF